MTARIVHEGGERAEPLTAWFGALDLPSARIGLEAAAPRQWLCGAMVKADLAVELIEIRHVREASRRWRRNRSQRHARQPFSRLILIAAHSQCSS
jgi:hypothetical protein